jgi:hypothetical protein
MGGLGGRKRAAKSAAPSSMAAQARRSARGWSCRARAAIAPAAKSSGLRDGRATPAADGEHQIDDRA